MFAVIVPPLQLPCKTRRGERMAMELMATGHSKCYTLPQWTINYPATRGGRGVKFAEISDRKETEGHAAPEGD